MAQNSNIANRIKFPQIDWDRAIQDLSYEVLYAYESLPITMIAYMRMHESI